MLSNYCKRTLSFLLALVMVFSMLPVPTFAEETGEGTHEHGDELFIEGSSLEEGEGAAPDAVLQVDLDDEHEHDWAVAESKDATCGEAGYIAYVCSCEENYVEELAATGEHSYEAVETVDATCGAEGYTAYVCAGCGDSRQGDLVPATGEHSYEDKKVEPTVESQGYTVHTCSVCGTSYEDSFVDPLPPAEHVHDFVAGEPVDATCTEKGYTPYACACGATESRDQIDALGHKYQDQVVAPTAVDQGYTKHTCSVCGDSYKDSYTDPVVEDTSSELLKQLRGMAADYVQTLGLTPDMTNSQMINHYIGFNGQKAQIAWEDYEAGYALAQELSAEELAIFRSEENTELAMRFYQQIQRLYNPMLLATYNDVVPGINVEVADAEHTSNSMTGDTISVEVNGYKNGLSNCASNTTVTITNTTSKKGTLSFNWTSNNTESVKVGDTALGSSPYTVDIEPQSAVTITVTSKSGNNKKGTFTMSSFSFVEIQGGASVTLSYDDTIGTVTTADGTFASGTTADVSASTGMTAVPKDGATFLAWVNADDNTIISTEAIYVPEIGATQDIVAAFASATTEAWFKVDGTYLFNDLNAAAAAGTTIVLAADGILPKGDYTIPAGVTLLIPFNASGTIYTTKPNMQKGQDTEPAVPSAFRTLHMADGAKVRIEGTMSVPAKVYAAGGSKLGSGTPYGTYGYVKMAEGSSITVANGGGLYCYGYINGSGTVTAESGSVIYESFMYEDFRGGTQMSEMVEGGDVAYSRVFPMNCYSVQNILAPLTLNAGAVEYGYACMTVSIVGAQGTSVAFIGGEGAMFYLKSGTVTKQYDYPTDRLILTADNADVQVNGIDMSVYTYKVNSKDYDLPLNGNMTINVNSGNITLNQNIVLLPGVELNVAKGASCLVSNGASLFIYDLDEWGNYVGSTNAKMYPVWHVPERQYKRTEADLKDAQVNIAGRVNGGAGFAYTTAGGAAIIGTEGATVTLKPGAADGINHQFIQGSGPVELSVANGKLTTARLQNGNGTYTDPAKMNPDLGVVYTYTDGVWVADCPGDDTCVFESEFACQPKKCKYCDYSDSKNTVEHTPGAAATCTAPQTCTVCGDVLVEALNHKNGTNPTDAVPVYCYSDAAGHKAYYTCRDCGVHFEDNACTKPIADLTAWLAEGGNGYVAIPGHTWNGGNVTKNPTCTEPGERTVQCTACAGAGMTTTDIVPEPATGHQKVTPTAQVDATCTDDGVKAYYYCSDCTTYYATSGSEDNKVLSDPITYLATWKTTEGQGKIAALGHKVTEHAGQAATCAEFGIQTYYSCETCGKNYTTKVSDTELSGEITKNINTWLDTEGEGKIAKLSHTEKTVAEEPATCLTPGKKAGVECEVCKAPISGREEISQKDHAGQLADNGKAATCTVDGYKAHYKCTNGCKKLYADEVCTTEITDLTAWQTTGQGKIPALDHHLVKIAEVPKTCTTAGTAEHYKCVADAACNKNDCTDRTVFCGALFEDAQGTKATTADKLVIPAAHTPAEAVKENEDKTTGVYEQVIYCAVEGCETDGKRTEISRTTIVPGVAVEHDLEMLDRVEPTCHTTGLTAGARCKVGYDGGCAACYNDGKTYELAQEEIPMLPHTVNPSAIQFVWNGYTECTASAPCVNNGCNETVTETVTAQETGRVDATCNEAGSITYTSNAFINASFVNAQLAPQVATETLVQLGHEWGEVEYKWSEDKKSCTAIQTCSNNTCFNEETDADIEIRDISATCTEPGKIIRVANFVETWHAEEDKVQKLEIESETAKGHTYTATNIIWNTTGENATCTADLVCHVCAEDSVAITAAQATVTKDVKQQDTCDQAGEILYTAVFTAPEGSKDTMPAAQTRTEYPDAVQHNWGTISFKWGENNATCTASRTCSVDPSHVEFQTVNATADEGTADCDDAGVITHTAQFTEGAFAGKTDTAETAQAALGHDTKPVAEVSPTCKATGVEAHVKCERCDLLFKTEADAVANTPVNADALIMAIVPCSFVDYVYNEDASCTKAGTKTAVCAFGCGKTSTINDADHPQLNHVYTNYIYNNDASCQKAGTETAECDTCDTGAKDTRDSAEYPKMDHAFTKIEVTQKPTCTAAGTQKVTCVNGCNSSNTEEIAKLGHVYAEQQGQAATCYAEGWENYYQCTSTERDCCGLYFANVNDTNSIDLETWKTDAGEIGKIAHSYNAVVTAPTCLEQGYTTYTCTTCPAGSADSYVDDYEDALQHKYDTVGAVTTQPTCTTDGIRTFTCQNSCCTELTVGHTRTEPVEALGHELVRMEGKDSTCDELGYNAYYQCAAVSRTGGRNHCGYYFANENDTKVDAEPIATNEEELNAWQKTSAAEGGGALAQLRQCADADFDHECDFEDCNKPMGEHKDASPKDHKCDTYGESCALGTFDTHVENKLDQEHRCDYCGVKMGDHVYTDGKCTCGDIQVLKVNITIKAAGQDDKKLAAETINYQNDGADFTKTLDLSGYGSCYTINDLSATVNGIAVESTKTDNTLTIESELLTGDIEIIVNAQQNHQIGDQKTVIVTPATCEQAGEQKIVTYCANCKEPYKETPEVIQPLKHNWEITYVDPTFDADGYTKHHCKNDSDHDYNEIDEGTKLIAVAMIGSDKYATLEEAITAANGKGAILLLGKYVVEGTQTWDLGRAQLYIADVDDNYGLIIKGDLTIKSGTYYAQGMLGIGVQPAGKLTIEDGTFENWGHNDYLIGSWGTTVINGGEFVGQYNCVNGFAGSLTINDGEFETDDYDSTGEYESADVFAADDVAQIKGGIFSKSVADYVAEGHCQVEYRREFDVAPHEGRDAYRENEVPATCDTDGSYDLVTECDRCEAEISRVPNVVPATGHTVEVIPGLAATCLEDGYLEAYYCSVCEKYFATRDTENDKLLSNKIEDLAVWQTTENAGKIGALGHELVHNEEVPAACETSGVKEYWQCSRCAAAFEDAQETVSIADLAAWKAEGGNGYIGATDHNYTSEVTTKPTCTEDGVRTYTCQKDKSHTYPEVEPKLNHNYAVEYKWNEDRTACTASAVCTNDPNHTADRTATVSVSVTTPADCENDGAGIRTAAFPSNNYGIEDQTEDVVIPATGHSFTKYVSNNDATCTEDGTKTAVCDYGCGKADTLEDTGSAKGHSMQEYQAVAATCTNTGIIHHYFCGACLGRFHDAEGKQPVETGKHITPALEHDYQTTVTEPTCEAKGYTTYTCSRGDSTYKDDYVDALNHDWDDGVILEGNEPTCTVAGTRTYTCVRGCTKTETVTATGHKGQTISGKAATCTVPGWIAYYQCQNSCGLFYADYDCTKLIGDADALEIWKTTDGKTGPYGHTYQAVPGKTPDCDDAGYLASFICSKSYCAQHFIENEEGEKVLIGDGSQAAYDAWIAEGGAGHLDPKGHTDGEMTIEKVVAPQCTVDGSHDEVTYCIVCKAETSRNTVVDAQTGHTEEDRTGKAATCTAAGLTDGKYCTVCKTWTVQQTTIPAKGHTNETIPAVAPTCTEPGMKAGVKCSACGDILTAQVVDPAKGHSYSEIIKTVNPTCTEDGYTELKCQNCDDTKTNPITAPGHNSNVTIPAVAPTCTATGLTEGKKCSVCQTVTEAQKPVDATGHQEISTVKQQDATCKADGVKAYSFCDTCDVYFKDEACTEAIGDANALAVWKNNDGKITKLKHVEQAIPAVAPTCTVDGLKPGVKCSVCGDILLAQAVDPAKGHSKVADEAVDPTCTATGLTAGEHCSKCDWKIEQQVVEATGHLKNTTIAQEDSDCTNDGVKEYYYCEDCGKYYASKISDTELADEITDLTAWKATSGKIDKLGHQEEDIPAVPATCTETGLTVGKKCTVCGETTVKQDTVPVLGHNEVIDGKVDPTCTETGLTEGKHCSRCDWKIEQEIVEPKGHKGFVLKGQPAKCEQDGYKDYYQCGNGCQLFFQDLACTQPIADVDAWKIAEDGGKIAMLGHAWDDGRVTTLPECEKEGVRTFTCGNCNGTKTGAEPALGHDVVINPAKKPTYTSPGWEEYETCARPLCDHNTMVAIPALGEAEITNFDDFIENLAILEDIADTYVKKVAPGKDPAMLVIKYIRTGVDRYNSGSWNIMAGYEDSDFAEYVRKYEEAYNAELADGEEMMMVSGMKNINEFSLPNGDWADIGHVFGSMDITYTNKTSIDHADVSGWAGDTVDLMSMVDQFGWESTNLEDMIKEINTKYFLKFREDFEEEPVEGTFSNTDMEGDLDAFYVMQTFYGREYENGTLTDIFSSYMTPSLTSEDRAAFFLNKRLGGVTLRSDVRDAVYNEVLGNSVVATLEGTRPFKTTDITQLRKACCYVVADYLCRLAGDFIEIKDNEYFHVFQTETSTLAPGIVQKINHATTADGKTMVYYTATGDVTSGNVHVYANYHNNDPAGGWAMQRVIDQANIAQEKYGNPESEHYIENYNVIASINGAGYDMYTGEPSGVLVMNGKEYHPIGASGFFGILDDGTAMIGSMAEYNELQAEGRVKEAIATFGDLIRDGKIIASDGGDRASRTAIGVTATGKVVFMVLDGRQGDLSCGGNMKEIAQIMLEAGCHVAVNLDGGGSSTYVAKEAGESELAVVSKPSDGISRSVSTSLLMVSTAPDSSAFDRAVIDSNYSFFTVNSTDTFSATAVSVTGNVVDMPEGTEWAVSNGQVGSITPDGVFTAKSRGTAEVQLKLNGAVIGSKKINVVNPDNVYFEKSTINAIYGQPIELPVRVAYEGKAVAFNEADVTLSLADAAHGSVDGFSFTGNEASGLRTIKVTANLTCDPSVTATINMAMYTKDEASFDFENASGGDLQLSWVREVSNSNMEGTSVYRSIDRDEPMKTNYTFAMDMSQIEMPAQLKDLTYMLPGADVEGNNTAWSFLLQLAERVSVLTEVTPVLYFDKNLDVDYSKLSINNEYFYLKEAIFNEEENSLTLVMKWHRQVKPIDIDAANPMCIVTGITLTPKDDAAWNSNDALVLMNKGTIGYDIYLRANALYSFSSKPENQEIYGLYPFTNVREDGVQENGGHFVSVYKEFEDQYTLLNGIKEGWVVEDGGFAYYVNGEKYTGIREIDGFYYDFGENGVNIGQKKYTGVMTDAQGNEFYLVDGLMYTGWMVLDMKNVRYYNPTTGIREKLIEAEVPSTCIIDGHCVYTSESGATKRIDYDDAGGHDYVKQANGSNVCELCGYLRIEMKDVSVKLSYYTATYSGTAKTPGTTATAPDGRVLTKPGQSTHPDYYSTYKNNVDVGTASVTLTASKYGKYSNLNDWRGNAAGEITVTYEIRPDAPAEAKLQTNGTDVIFSWTAAKAPGVTYVIYVSADGTNWTELATTTDLSYTMNEADAAGKIFRVGTRKVVNGKTYESLNKAEAPAIVVSIGTTEEGKPTLTWNATKGAKEFHVYRSNTQDGNFNRVFVTKGTSYTHASAVAGNSYYYYVKVILTNGTELVSEVVSNTFSAPVEKIEVTTDHNTDGKPLLKWTAVSGAVKYRVYRSNTEAGNYVYVFETKGQSYTHISAKVGNSYFYYVKAVKGDGTEVDSEIVTNTCIEPETKFTITTGNNAEGKPILKWTAATGADHYEVYRSTTENGTYVKVFSTTGRSYTHVSATAGRTYYYKVKIVSKDGTELFSPVVANSCLIPNAGFSIVTGHNVAGKPTLKWKAIAGAARYEVYRSNTLNGEFVKVFSTKGTTYTNSSAKAGNTYYYKLKVYLVDGTEKTSDVMTNTCLVPGAVFNITTGHNADGKPTLKWNAIVGATNYEVYRSETSDGEFVKTFSTKGTTYTNTAAKAGNTYYYKLKVYLADGTEKTSDVVSNICLIPGVVFNVETGNNAEGKPTLKWTPIVGADHYEVYRANSVDGEYVLTFTTKGTTYTNTGAKAGNTYYYKLVVYLADGTSETSEIYSNVCLTGTK